MEEIAVSESKVKCIAVLERVRKTTTPIRITRDGQPVAEIIPSSPVQERSAWIGVHEIP